MEKLRCYSRLCKFGCHDGSQIGNLRISWIRCQNFVGKKSFEVSLGWARSLTWSMSSPDRRICFPFSRSVRRYENKSRISRGVSGQHGWSRSFSLTCPRDFSCMLHVCYAARVVDRRFRSSLTLSIGGSGSVLLFSSKVVLHVASRLR